MVGKHGWTDSKGEDKEQKADGSKLIADQSLLVRAEALRTALANSAVLFTESTPAYSIHC